MIGNILDNTTELYMIKYAFGEMFSSGGATLCKNHSDQTVPCNNFVFYFQNDIENVFPFVFLGFLYISTNPTLAGAKLAFRIFTAARFLHSITYVFAVSIIVFPHF